MFLYWEKRPDTRPDLRITYQGFIQELLGLQHMEDVTETVIKCSPSQKCHLRHHCIFKENFITTNLGVVFDCSFKTTKVSIDEAMMVGSIFQDDRFSMNTQFWFYKIALSGDVHITYRRVGLRKAGRYFHRILWRDTSASPNRHFRLTKLFYGVSCLAIFPPEV